MSSNSNQDNKSPLIRRVSYWQLTILVGLVLIRGFIYAALFPPWIAPDEPGHFQTIRIIGQYRELPDREYYQSTPMDPELSQSLQTFRWWQFAETSTPTRQLNITDTTATYTNYPFPGGLVLADQYPILPHLVLAPISYLTSPVDIVTQLYLFRLISIVLAVGVVVMAWSIVRKVFPNHPQFWLAIPVFIVFLPMRTHIFASLGTDAFAILLTSGLLLLFISFFEAGVSKLKVGLTIILLISTLFTKRTAIFVIVWAGLAAILYLRYRTGWGLKRIVTIGLIIATIIGGVLGWMIFNPEVMARLNINSFNLRFNRLPYLFQLIQGGMPIAEIAKIHLQLVLFAFITFWGVFGFNNINIPWPWAWGLMVLCAILLIGTFIYFVNVFRRPQQTSRFQRYVLILFVFGVVLALGSAFFPALIVGPKWGPQARYYFPALIPMATLLYLGAWQLCPENYRHIYLLPLWVASLVLYDTLVIINVLIPFFYA